jgi:hypothetical protein
METYIAERIYAKSKLQMKTTEGFIELHIRPKPRWMPTRIHRWILGKIIYLAEFRSDLRWGK